VSGFCSGPFSFFDSQELLAAWLSTCVAIVLDRHHIVTVAVSSSAVPISVIDVSNETVGFSESDEAVSNASSHFARRLSGKHKTQSARYSFCILQEPLAFCRVDIDMALVGNLLHFLFCWFLLLFLPIQDLAVIPNRYADERDRVADQVQLAD